MTDLLPSPRHIGHADQVEPFLGRVEAQVAELVAAGLPLAGADEFIRRWFEAWRDRDTERIVACATPDVEFIDPGTSGVLRGRPTLRDYTDRFFRAVPDLVFYPQRGAEVLPYWDTYGGVGRVTLPWRAIGRFVAPLSLPGWPTIAPTGRTMDFVGIDRYVFGSNWQIARIDTDYDMVGVLQQVSLLPNLKHPAIKGALAVERAVAPLLRLTART
jgi:hypothetical protein